MTDVIAVSTSVEVIETTQGEIEIVEVGIGGGVTSYNDLTDLPTLGTAAAAATGDFEAAGAVATHAAVTSSVHGISAFGATLVDDADASTARGTLGLGTAATTASTDYAPAAQGVTNGDSHDHSGGDGAQIAYSSLSGLPSLGTAAATASTDYATAAQGGLADSAMQPGDDAADLGSGAATDNYVLTADGIGGAAWEAAAVTYAGAASEIHAATSKTTPVDADQLGLVDSVASYVLKKLTWANLKATIASYLNLKTATGAIGGTNNLAIGTGNFTGTVTGNNNVAISATALASLTSGSNNFALGANTLTSNISGNYNVAIGNSCLENATNSNNTGIGTFSLRTLTSGYSNLAIGYYSQYSATTGANNVSIGVSSLQNNVSGIGNIAIGYAAAQNETGSNKLYIENSNSASPLIYGEFNTDIVRINGMLYARKTTEQLRLEYDATYYASFTVNSSGALTQTAIAGQTFIGGTGVTSKVTVQGTSGNGTSTATAIEFKVGNNGNITVMYMRNDGNIYLPGPLENTTSGEGIVLKSPDGTRYKLTVANGGTLSIAAA